VPSPPSHAVARDLADRIIDRRTAAPDPHLADLGDSLEEVVAHIGRTRDRTGRDLLGLDDIDPDIIRADVVDGFVILDYLSHHYARQIARWRLGLYEAGRRAGMGPTALMEPMHQRHRQGVDERIKRDRALLNPHAELAGREQADAAATRVACGELRALAETLVALRLALPDDLEDATGYDVDDLASAIGGPGFVSILRLIVRHILSVPVNAEVRDVLDHTHAHLVDQLGLGRVVAVGGADDVASP
jgi:hypothetical protein